MYEDALSSDFLLKAKLQLNDGEKPIFLKFFSDKSPAGTWGLILCLFVHFTNIFLPLSLASQSYYPIYLTLENLPLSLQQTNQGKLLIGYIPILDEINKTPIYDNLHSFCNMLVWHRCIRLLLKPLRHAPSESFFLSHSQPFCSD